VWINTATGKELRKDLPVEAHNYPGENGIKLIFLIDTPEKYRPLLSPIADAINGSLAGKLRLFGVRRITLMDFDTARAREIGIRISRQRQN
jgi:hypothetical protein